MNDEEEVDKVTTSSEFYLGLLLAISSSLFIGSSFIIKKKGLIRLSRIGKRANAGGFGYLRDIVWWFGLLTMGLGEVLNFTAYMFAPASLVTPLGALSVIVAAILSSKFLNDRLNLIGKLGCLLCIIGSTIIVLHSPKEAEISDLDLLIEKAKDTTFIIYVMIIIAISIIIACYLGPRVGNKNVLIYIILCSSIGSLTVMSCKALGLAIRDQISGRSNDFGTSSLPYLLIIITVIFIGVQMNYLNKALDTFSTSVVTPIYYVMFTTLVILASAILFKEFKNMEVKDIVGDICGFLIVIIAIILLNAFRDMEVSMDDITSQLRPKRKLVSLSNSNSLPHRPSISYNCIDDTLIARNSNYGTSSDSDRNV